MPPVIAIDAMGGDRAPAEIVAGALKAVRRVRCRRAARRPGRRAARPPARRRRARARRDPRRVRGHRDGRGTRGRGADEEGLVDRARARRRCATVAPRRWSARATPARRWPPRCCGSAASRACTGPRSRFRSRCSARTACSCSSTAAPRSIPIREWLVEWAELARAYAAGPPRCRRADDRVAVERRGAREGRRAAQACVGALRRREGLRRQRRGSRRRPAQRRRHHHRRLHGQRHAEDARRCGDGSGRTRVRRGRRTGIAVGATRPTH